MKTQTASGVFTLSCLALLGAIPLIPLWGQTAPEQALEFEVASVKRHLPPPGMVTVVLRSSPPTLPDHPRKRFSDHSTSVKVLIERAYDLRAYQILGLPDWADPEASRFGEYCDVDAIAPMDNPTRPQLQVMLQSLSAERFQLKLHRETRDLPVYVLMVAKHGVKFKSVEGEPTPTSPTMYMLVQMLSTHVDRPIVDGTGLNGYYDFPSLREIFLEHPDSALALSTLLRESFGLELKPEKESMDVLIVDHVQRPSPN